MLNPVEMERIGKRLTVSEMVKKYKPVEVGSPTPELIGEKAEEAFEGSPQLPPPIPYGPCTNVMRITIAIRMMMAFLNVTMFTWCLRSSANCWWNLVGSIKPWPYGSSRSWP